MREIERTARAAVLYGVLTFGCYAIWEKFHVAFIPVGDWSNRPYSALAGFITFLFVIWGLVFLVRTGGRLAEDHEEVTTKSVLRQILLVVASPFVFFLCLLGAMDTLAMFYTRSQGLVTEHEFQVTFREKLGRRKGWCPYSFRLHDAQTRRFKGDVCLSQGKFKELAHVVGAKSLNGWVLKVRLTGRVSAVGLQIDAATVRRPNGDAYAVLPDTMGYF